jgi:Cu+-exporting ATPase
MVRRNFIRQITLASAGVGMVEASPSQTVTYHVKGFTCPTCAVGLDTLLRRQTGVIQSKSTYPGGTTVIDFNPRLIDDKSLKNFISELGFTAEEEPKHHE